MAVLGGIHIDVATALKTDRVRSCALYAILCSVAAAVKYITVLYGSFSVAERSNLKIIVAKHII